VKKPETLFKERIAPKLKALPNSWWFKTQQVALRGIPDFVGVVNGRFVALELKKSANAPASKLQAYILLKISKAGGIGRFVTPENWEAVFADLEKIPALHLGE